MNRNLVLSCSAVMVFLFGCGGGPQPAQAPTPEPAAKPSVPAKSVEPAAPLPSASASEVPTPPEPVAPPERKGPMTMLIDPTEPATIGLDGAVFRVGERMELKIPGGAFTAVRNVMISEVPKFSGAKDRLGSVYLIDIQVPGAKFKMDGQRPSRHQSSAGAPFVLKMPLPSGSQSANLAVETRLVDETSKRAKSAWAIVAMTKVETADSGNRAVFELGELPDGHVYLTNKAP